jgi:hypothetical protein
MKSEKSEGDSSVINFIKKYTGVLLLLISIIIGLLTYKNYGISYDEARQRDIGLTTYNYVFHGDRSLLDLTQTWPLTLQDRYYGTTFEVPLIVIEKAFRLNDSRDIYLMRHLVTHLFFLFSAFVFFLLIDYLYKSKLLAAIGFLLLVVNPLIYGHSFFNTKDIPFLSMFIICFMLCALAFDKNTYKHFALLGIVCGTLTDMRMMGILLIGCISFLFIIDYFFSLKDKIKRRKILYLFLTYWASTLLAVYAAWPLLWLHPFKKFSEAFSVMSKFPWLGYSLFNGRPAYAQNLPRIYSLVWFSISNPVIYLVLGCCGIIFFIIHFIRGHNFFFENRIQRNNILYLLCFFCPLLVIIILHSALYDSWRQLFFIYPSFVLLAIYGLAVLLRTKLKLIAAAVVMTGIGLTVFYMIDTHPFEHIYFNEFIPHKPEYIRKHWEMDYWGTSYKQGLDYIVKNDTSKKINIYVSEWPGISNSYLLKPADRNRLFYVNAEDKADYFLTDYRSHPDDFPLPASQIYYSIKVLNSTILTVYKLKK